MVNIEVRTQIALAITGGEVEDAWALKKSAPSSIRGLERVLRHQGWLLFSQKIQEEGEVNFSIQSKKSKLGAHARGFHKEEKLVLPSLVESKG